MNMRLFFTLLVLCMSLELAAQGTGGQLWGEVSFVTSHNIYVKFANTQDIEVGDTIQLPKAATTTACLIVKQKSSTSCVCEAVNDCVVKKGDKVVFSLPQLEKKEEFVEEELITEPNPVDEIEEENKVSETKEEEGEPLYKEKIRGRISAASYSTFSPNRDNRHRMMYRFSFNADNINNSKFSLESYINYRQNFLPSSDVTGQRTKFFRVYNLALRYELNPTTSILIGRKINNKASSIGAVDGLQVEKTLGNYYVGVMVGFRPDIFEYGLNPNLLQYGGYIGRVVNTKNVHSKTTLGFFEQRNAGELDREYTYFQHSSSINRKLNLFGSFQLDLYKKVNGIAATDIRLSNLFLSARYRFSRKFDVNISYDSRRRILFYETFKTEIEQMLSDDIARQGVRLRVNVKPLKYISTGASYSKRFQSDQQNKSDNINAFISVSKVPYIGGRFSTNFNNNKSNYLDSKIISLRYSRPLIKKKLNGDFYFRNVSYQYLNSDLTSNQQYFGGNFSYRLSRKLSFSLLGEISSRTSGKNYRVNTKIVKRFDKKRKK